MGDAPELRCPLVTPFDDDGDLDLDSLATLVDHLVHAGVDGMVPCGTTGEFASLTDEERRRVVETVVDAADGRVPVTAGVGGTAVDDVRAHIRDAEAAGADSVLVPQPYYGEQPSAEGNEAFFRDVLRDAPLPAFVYDIPSATGQELQTEAVLALADHDAVVGVKDSSGEITAVDAAIEGTPDGFTVWQGWDAGLVPALVMGADGGVSSMSHLVPQAMTDAVAAVAEGDIDRARVHQFEAIDPVFRVCAEHGFAPAIKAVLAEHGRIASDHVRPPQESLDPSERGEVLDALDDARNSKLD